MQPNQPGFWTLLTWRFCFAQAALQAFNDVLQGADGMTYNLSFVDKISHFL